MAIDHPNDAVNLLIDDQNGLFQVVKDIPNPKFAFGQVQGSRICKALGRNIV